MAEITIREIKRIGAVRHCMADPAHYASDLNRYTAVRFHMIEADSFGPLIRGCKATDPNGKQVEFFYG